MSRSFGVTDSDEGGVVATIPTTVSEQDETGQTLVMRGIPATFKKHSLQRVFPDRDVVANTAKIATHFVAAQLHERRTRQKLADEQLRSLLAPARDALKRDQEGAARMARLRKAQKAVAEIKNGQGQSAHHHSPPQESFTRPAFISLQPGINFVAPPWDFSFFDPNPPNFPFEFVNGNVFSNTGLYVATPLWISA
jgi:hypothetical protein